MNLFIADSLSAGAPESFSVFCQPSLLPLILFTSSSPDISVQVLCRDVSV